MIRGMKELGAYIARTREQRGFRTQTAFAEAIGKPQTVVSRIERGAAKVLPPPEDLRLIADGLQVPVAKLLEVAGYLDPVQSPTEGYTVPAGDPRMEILLLLDGASDDEVEGVLRVLRPVLDMVQRSDIQSPKATTQPRSRSTRDAS